MTKYPHLPQLEGLLDLACRNGVDVRSTLLRVLTDLYIQKPFHRTEEEAQYVELAQHLIDTADPVTRATVAARLAGYSGAPVAILRKLEELSGQQVAPPTETPREQAENELAELFFGADGGERRLILANLDVAGPSSRAKAPDTATAMLVEAAVLGRDDAQLLRILQRALAIDATLAQRIIADRSGEPIAVAAKFIGMPAPMFQRVLLFLDPAIGQSVERVYSLASLYSELSPQTAAAMVDIWRGSARKRQPAHRPVYYDDQRAGARTAASASHARTTRRSDSLAARFRNSGR